MNKWKTLWNLRPSNRFVGFTALVRREFLFTISRKGCRGSFCFAVGVMPLKFAANISTLFQNEDNFLARFGCAKLSGFSAVECQFPYDYPEDALASARQKADVEHVLINSFPGDGPDGKHGFAAKPHYEAEFRSSLDVTLKYAKALNCKRIHIMAGREGMVIQDAEVEEAYEDNLIYATELLGSEGIMCLIEPQCAAVSPMYFLNSFDKALKFIKKINSPHLKLQLDIFHLQMICGNLTENIKLLMPHVGHIQVSQAPKRNELNATGEVNYEYVLDLLDKEHYDGWIGLEYVPTSEPSIGFSWLQKLPYWSN